MAKASPPGPDRETAFPAFADPGRLRGVVATSLAPPVAEQGADVGRPRAEHGADAVRKEAAGT